MREPKHIGQEEMRTLLCGAYSEDPEKSFPGQLTRRLLDPAGLRDANNHPRPHPLWLILSLLAAFVVGVFVYFNFFRS
jgi:hypothetical protein